MAPLIPAQKIFEAKPSDKNPDRGKGNHNKQSELPPTLDDLPPLEMRPTDIGEEVRPHERTGKPITYLNDESKSRFELHIKDGLIYDASGKLLNTNGEQGIFVMSMDGKIYFAPKDIAVPFAWTSRATAFPHGAT